MVGGVLSVAEVHGARALLFKPRKTNSHQSMQAPSSSSRLPPRFRIGCRSTMPTNMRLGSLLRPVDIAKSNSSYRAPHTTKDYSPRYMYLDEADSRCESAFRGPGQMRAPEATLHHVLSPPEAGAHWPGKKAHVGGRRVIVASCFSNNKANHENTVLVQYATQGFPNKTQFLYPVERL